MEHIRLKKIKKRLTPIDQDGIMYLMNETINNKEKTMTEAIKIKTIEAIKAISNEYNKTQTDSLLKRIDQVVDGIIKMMDKAKSDDESHIDAIINLRLTSAKRTLTKDLTHFVLVHGEYGQYYLFIKTKDRGLRIYDDMYVDSEAEAIEIAEQEDKIRVQGYTGVDSISFPSGEIIFANYFPSSDDYAFEVADDLKYKDKYSINSRRGQQNCMEYKAEKHGCGYAQLGNTTCSVYKVSDEKIVLTTNNPYWYDDEGYEIEVEAPEGWEYLGNFDCAVWRTEFADKFFVDNSTKLDKKSFAEEEKVVANVTPGEWSFKNHYFNCDDDEALKNKTLPVWVEITRNK